MLLEHEKSQMTYTLTQSCLFLHIPMRPWGSYRLHTAFLLSLYRKCIFIIIAIGGLQKILTMGREEISCTPCMMIIMIFSLFLLWNDTHPICTLLFPYYVLLLLLFHIQFRLIDIPSRYPISIWCNNLPHVVYMKSVIIFLIYCVPFSLANKQS